MADYVGTPWEAKPFEYKSSVPLDLINRGLATKQGQTDTVKQSVQGDLDNLGNTTFYKDSDRALVNDRIQNTVNSLNNFAGSDLTDGRTQTALMGVVNGLTSDPDVVDRIMANRNYGKQRQAIDYIKQHHPEQYSGVNENYFNLQAADWMKDPNKTAFNATYQPYNNYDADMNTAVKSILDNPDVQDQIMYTTDATGKKVPRLYHGVGMSQSITDVSRQKLLDGVNSAWNGANDAQLQLEYKNAMATNGAAVATQHVQGLYKNYVEQATSYQNMANQARVSGQDPKQWQDQADKYSSAAIEAATNMGKLATGEVDPSSLVTYDHYKYDKLYQFADSHAYRKEGKVEWNPVDMAYQKHIWDMQEEDHKAALKKKGDSDSIPHIELGDVIDNVYGPRGKASATMPTFKAINGVSDKQEKDGYVPMAFSNEDVFNSLASAVGSATAETDARKVQGYEKFINDQAQWMAAHTQKPKPIYDQVHDDGSIIGYDYSKSFYSTDDFLSDLKANNKLGEYKDNYGLDLNTAADVTNLKKAVQKVAAVQGPRGSHTSITGNLMVQPVYGDNVLRGDNGTLLSTMITQPMKRDELEYALGNGDQAAGSKIFDAYMSAQSIKPVGVKPKFDDKGKQNGSETVYAWTFHRPVKGDMNSVIANTTRDATSSGVYKDSGPDIYDNLTKKYQEGIWMSKVGAPSNMQSMASDIVKASPSTESIINAQMNDYIQGNMSADDAKKFAIKLKTNYDKIHKNDK